MSAPRTPFVLLVLGLLGGGLVGLLLLSSAASADAFTQRRLQQENRALSLREQELGREVAALEAPGSLAERARRLGLVQGAEPGFLVLEPGGAAKVVGSPVPATSPPPPPPPSPTVTPSGTPGAGPTPGASTSPAAGPATRTAPASGRAARTTPAPAPATPTPTPAPGGGR